MGFEVPWNLWRYKICPIIIWYRCCALEEDEQTQHNSYGRDYLSHFISSSSNHSERTIHFCNLEIVVFRWGQQKVFLQIQILFPNRILCLECYPSRCSNGDIYGVSKKFWECLFLISFFCDLFLTTTRGLQLSKVLKNNKLHDRDVRGLTHRYLPGVSLFFHPRQIILAMKSHTYKIGPGTQNPTRSELDVSQFGDGQLKILSVSWPVILIGTKESSCVFLQMFYLR